VNAVAGGLVTPAALVTGFQAERDRRIAFYGLVGSCDDAKYEFVSEQ
jgi:hypothetical protein